MAKAKPATSSEKKIAAEKKAVAKKPGVKKTATKASSVKKSTPPSSAVKTKSITTTAKRASVAKKSKKAATKKTRVVVYFDVGFENKIYVRGDVPNLNWDQGIALENVSRDQWVWETEKPFNCGEFKVLINDLYFEAGENHKLEFGETLVLNPSFPTDW